MKCKQTKRLAASVVLGLMLTGSVCSVAAAETKAAVKADGVPITASGSQNITSATDDVATLYALNGGTITLTNGTTLVGESAIGNAGAFCAQGANSQIVATGVETIVTTGATSAAGILSVSGSVDASAKIDLQMTGEGTITVTAIGNDDGSKGVGIVALNKASATVEGVKSLTVNNNGAITAAELVSYGVSAENGSTVSVNASATTNMGDLTVNSTNYDAIGIRADDNSSATYKGLTALNVTTVREEKTATGITATKGSEVEVSLSGDMTISASWDKFEGDATGIYSSNDSTATVNFVSPEPGEPGNLIVKGSGDAYGVSGLFNPDDTNYTNCMTTVEGVQDIIVKGNTARGISGMAVFNDDTVERSFEMKVNMDGKIDVEATSVDPDKKHSAYGISCIGDEETLIDVTMNKGDIYVTSKLDSTGILAILGQVSVTGADDISISATDEDSGTVCGINAGTGGQIDVQMSGDMLLTGAKATGITTGLKDGVVRLQGGKEDGSLSRMILESSSGTALFLGNGGLIELTNFQVEANEDNQLAIGVVVTENDKSNTLNAYNSVLQGGADFDGDSLNEGVAAYLNINLDEKSLWYGGAASKVAEGATGGINLNNAGTWVVAYDSDLGGGTITNNALVFYRHNSDANDKYITVQAKAASGTGVYCMHTNMETGGSTAGVSDKLILTGTEGGNVNVYLVNTGNSVNVQDSMVDKLVETPNGSTATAQLVNDGDRMEVGMHSYVLEQEDDASGWYVARSSELSNKGKAVVGSVVTPDIWYTESEALYNAAGRRDAQHKQNVWTQGTHSKWGTHGVNTKFNGMQVGWDTAVSYCL